jgi:hypothetical protein
VRPTGLPSGRETNFSRVRESRASTLPPGCTADHELSRRSRRNRLQIAIDHAEPDIVDGSADARSIRAGGTHHARSSNDRVFGGAVIVDEPKGQTLGGAPAQTIASGEQTAKRGVCRPIQSDEFLCERRGSEADRDPLFHQPVAQSGRVGFPLLPRECSLRGGQIGPNLPGSAGRPTRRVPISAEREERAVPGDQIEQATETTTPFGLAGGPRSKSDMPDRRAHLRRPVQRPHEDGRIAIGQTDGMEGGGFETMQRS